MLIKFLYIYIFLSLKITFRLSIDTNNICDFLSCWNPRTFCKHYLINPPESFARWVAMVWKAKYTDVCFFLNIFLTVSHILTKIFRLSIAISRDQAWRVLCSQLLSIDSNWEHVFVSAGVIVWQITMKSLKDSIWQSYFLTSPLSPDFLHSCFHLVRDPPRQREVCPRNCISSNVPVSSSMQSSQCAPGTRNHSLK